MRLASQLDLEIQDRIDVSLTDGSLTKYAFVGPVNIRFENRSASSRVLVLLGTDEVLLGVFPLEGMDVMIDSNSAVGPSTGKSYYAGVQIK